MEARLDDTNLFTDEAGGAAFYLEDEEEGDHDGHRGIQRGETPASEDYGDMIVDEAPEADNLDEEAIDMYLGAELMFDVGSGSERRGHVVERSRGLDGAAMIGRAHANPLFDTRGVRD